MQQKVECFGSDIFFGREEGYDQRLLESTILFSKEKKLKKQKQSMIVKTDKWFVQDLEIYWKKLFTKCSKSLVFES